MNLMMNLMRKKNLKMGTLRLAKLIIIVGCAYDQRRGG